MKEFTAGYRTARGRGSKGSSLSLERVSRPSDHAASPGEDVYREAAAATVKREAGHWG